MFDALVVQPIFNLLVLIYALLPGQNFGLAIILFTVLVRFMLWPLVKKQLHHTRALRKLQPELKRIKKAAAGNRQKEQLLMMELYKERGIRPFSSFGILIVQFIILIGLYQGLNRVARDPQAILDNAYGFIRSLPGLQPLVEDISRFDATLFGVIDLTKAALPGDGGVYIPAMQLVIGSALVQYFQSVQLMPKTKDARTLRQILSQASEGKQADQAEVNAAITRNMRFFIPGLIFVFTVGLPSALSLYWFTGGLVAYLQQARVLKQDEDEMEELAEEPTKRDVIEGEVIEKKETNTAKKKKTAKSKKRRKK